MLSANINTDVLYKTNTVRLAGSKLWNAINTDIPS